MAELATGASVMENLRFDPGKKRTTRTFVRRLVDGFDCFVNDAFGACHRSHASIVGPPALMPSAAGRLPHARGRGAHPLLVHPEHPFVAVVGGAKVADKLGVLNSIAQRADHVLLGGAMCFTFLRALGNEVGASHVETELIDNAKCLLDRYPGIEIPRDIVALSPGGNLGIGRPATGEVEQFTGDVPAGWQGVDIGPATRADFAEIIAGRERCSGMAPWASSRTLASPKALEPSPRRLPPVQDSAWSAEERPTASLHQFGLESHIDHISSGGGATLEFIEHGDLPGLAALRSSTAVRQG